MPIKHIFVINHNFTWPNTVHTKGNTCISGKDTTSWVLANVYASDNACLETCSLWNIPPVLKVRPSFLPPLTPPPHRKRQCPPSLQQAPRLQGLFTLPRCFCSPLWASTPWVLGGRRDTGYAGCPGGLVRDPGLRSHLSLTGQYLQLHIETLTLRNTSVCLCLQAMARGLNLVTAGFCMVHKLRMGFMFLNGWCSRPNAWSPPQIHLWKHIS